MGTMAVVILPAAVVVPGRALEETPGAVLVAPGAVTVVEAVEVEVCSPGGAV